MRSSAHSTEIFHLRLLNIDQVQFARLRTARRSGKVAGLYTKTQPRETLEFPLIGDLSKPFHPSSASFGIVYHGRSTRNGETSARRAERSGQPKQILVEEERFR